MMFGFITHLERPYPGCSYVSRIEQDYGPKHFKAGQDFDLAELGLTETQAMMLWSSGHLLVKPPAPPAPPAAPPRSATNTRARR